MTSFKTSNKSWLFTFILVLYIYFSFFYIDLFLCSSHATLFAHDRSLNTFLRLVYRRIIPAAETLSEKLNIWPRSEASGKCEILSQGHYPPIYQQARKEFIYFIILWLIFPSPTCWERKKNKNMWWARARMTKTSTSTGWFFFLLLLKLWLDQGLTGCRVKWTFATPHRSKIEKGALLVYILPTALFENYSKNLF